MSTPTLPTIAPPANSAGDPIPNLLCQLAGEDLKARLAAVADLGRLGALGVDALPELTELLHDDNASVRKAAARALGQMGLVALNQLAEALENPDKDVRRQAVWAIGRLGPQARPALAALCRTLKDNDSRTAAGAAQAVANIGPLAEPAIEALIGALESVNLVQCRLVAKALSEIGPPALPALIKKLSDPDYYVRREVAVAIGFMAMRGGPAVGPILDRLSRFTPPLVAPIAHTVPDKLTQTAMTPVKPMHPAPGDDRLVLIETLARIGPAASDARDYLIGTLNDADRRVAEAAAQALWRIMGWN
jgi:HEAT repeat protein